MAKFLIYVTDETQHKAREYAEVLAADGAGVQIRNAKFFDQPECAHRDGAETVHYDVVYATPGADAPLAAYEKLDVKTKCLGEAEGFGASKPEEGAAPAYKVKSVGKGVYGVVDVASGDIVTGDKQYTKAEAVERAEALNATA